MKNWGLIKGGGRKRGRVVRFLALEMGDGSGQEMKNLILVWGICDAGGTIKWSQGGNCGYLGSGAYAEQRAWVGGKGGT